MSRPARYSPSRNYPRPSDYRYHDSERLERLGLEYGLSRRPHRSGAPTRSDAVGALLLIAASAGATWLLAERLKAGRAAS